MMKVFPVKNEKCDKILAVIHADGSGRPQTVYEKKTKDITCGYLNFKKLFVYPFFQIHPLMKMSQSCGRPVRRLRVF